MNQPFNSPPPTPETEVSLRLRFNEIDYGITDKGCFVCGNAFNYPATLHRLRGKTPDNGIAHRIRKQCFLPNRYGVEVFEQPETDRILAIHACTDHLPNLAILFQLVERAGNVISADLVDHTRNVVISIQQS